MVTARRPARPGRRTVSRALPLRPLDSATSAGRASSAGNQARVSAQGRCLTASGSTLPLVVHRCARVLRPRATKRFRHSNTRFCLACVEFTTNSNYKIPQGSLKLQKVLVVKNTTSKNIGNLAVYHKGLSFVGNATRWKSKNSSLT